MVFCSCRFDSCRVNCCTLKNPTIQNNSVRLKNTHTKTEISFQKINPTKWLCNSSVIWTSLANSVTVQFRVKLKLTSLSTASNNNSLLPYLSSILNIFHPSHSLILAVPRSITKTFGQRSFNCQTVLIWNLPTARFATQLFFLCLRQAKILSLFSKSFLLKQSNPPPSTPLHLLWSFR